MTACHQDPSAVPVQHARYGLVQTQTVLASDFAVGRALIGLIVNGRRWKHVGGPIRTNPTPGRRPTRRAA